VSLFVGVSKSLTQLKASAYFQNNLPKAEDVRNIVNQFGTVSMKAGTTELCIVRHTRIGIVSPPPFDHRHCHTAEVVRIATKGTFDYRHLLTTSVVRIATKGTFDYRHLLTT
jgi:hypothetical protein